MNIRSRLIAVIPACAFFLAGVASAEQNYVSRFDVYAGYAWFDSPAVNLTEHGIQLQGGVRVTTWLSLGFDYTNVSGDLTLTGALLTPALQDQLRALLGRLAAAGQLPPNYSLLVPSESTTQTFAGGPQFAYRRWERVTLFIRPSCGLIREVATPQPGDPIARAVVSQLAPEGKKTDWTPFYGVGGGLDFNI